MYKRQPVPAVVGLPLAGQTKFKSGADTLLVEDYLQGGQHIDDGRQRYSIVLLLPKAFSMLPPEKCNVLEDVKRVSDNQIGLQLTFPEKKRHEFGLRIRVRVRVPSRGVVSMRVVVAGVWRRQAVPARGGEQQQDVREAAADCEAGVAQAGARCAGRPQPDRPETGARAPGVRRAVADGGADQLGARVRDEPLLRLDTHTFRAGTRLWAVTEQIRCEPFVEDARTYTDRVMDIVSNCDAVVDAQLVLIPGALSWFYYESTGLYHLGMYVEHLPSRAIVFPYAEPHDRVAEVPSRHDLRM